MSLVTTDEGYSELSFFNVRLETELIIRNLYEDNI
jgi:hypothetical protein